MRCLGHIYVDSSCEQKISKHKAAVAFCADCWKKLPPEEKKARKDFWWKDMVEFQDLKKKKKK